MASPAATADVWESFNQSIDRIAWPSSLRQLTVGNNFDQPIVGATWPASLKHLTIGRCSDEFTVPDEGLMDSSYFNRPVAGVE